MISLECNDSLLDFEDKAGCLERYCNQWNDVVEVGTGDLPGILPKTAKVDGWDKEIKCYKCNGMANSEVTIIKTSRRGTVGICEFCNTENRTYLIYDGGIPIFVDQYGVCQDGCFFFRAYSNSEEAWDILAKNLKYQREYQQACLDLNVLAKSLDWIEMP